MGSLSAMNSLERVITAHGDELVQEYRDQIPDQFKETITGVVLSNNTYTIDVEWALAGGQTLPGPSIDIDTLQERYPDCDVGY